MREIDGLSVAAPLEIEDTVLVPTCVVYSSIQYNEIELMREINTTKNDFMKIARFLAVTQKTIIQSCISWKEFEHLMSNHAYLLTRCTKHTTYRIIENAEFYRTKR